MPTAEPAELHCFVLQHQPKDCHVATEILLQANTVTVVIGSIVMFIFLNVTAVMGSIVITVVRILGSYHIVESAQKNEVWK